MDPAGRASGDTRRSMALAQPFQCLPTDISRTPTEPPAGNAIEDIGQSKAPALQLRFQNMAICPARRMALAGLASEGIERTGYRVSLLSSRRMPISIFPGTTGT